MESLTYYHGFPVVTATTCFDVVRRLGIKAWPKLCDDAPVTQWLETASSEEVTEYRRFAPKTLVAKHMNPHSGDTFNGFRLDFKPYSLVFALLDERYVVITAEWKHGNDKITLVPVCGVPSKEESHLSTRHEAMASAGLREVTEETGMTGEGLVPLSSSCGMFYSVRNTESRCYPFFCTISSAYERKSASLDEAEHLVVILFEIEEWLKLIEDNSLFEENQDFGLEDCARAATYAALRHLGRLKFV